MRKAKKKPTKNRALPEGVEVMLTVEDLAEIQHSHVQSVRAQMTKGVIPFVQIPGSRRKLVPLSVWQKVVNDNRQDV